MFLHSWIVCHLRYKQEMLIDHACSAAAARPPPAAEATVNPAFDRRTCVLEKESAREGHVAAVVVISCNRPDYLRLAMTSVLDVHGKDRANRRALCYSQAAEATVFTAAADFARGSHDIGAFAAAAACESVPSRNGGRDWLLR